MDLAKERTRALHIRDLYEELNHLQRGRGWTREEYMPGVPSE